MGMTIDNVLEILEKHKLHIPSNVFYELKADIVNFEEPTTKNDLGVDCISRAEVLRLMKDNWHTHNGDWAMQESMDDIRALPSATPQEPKTGHCRDCKWWKDSDGAFRRGIGAESKCPMNRIEVYEGNGYCYLFEPQESEDKE